ncbi:MAG: CHASE2 domain-containing protein [Robiginitomaculum sp.]|nr:CHASE2 domain-containing protein [Robiginitomaculum sp.]
MDDKSQNNVEQTEKQEAPAAVVLPGGAARFLGILTKNWLATRPIVVLSFIFLFGVAIDLFDSFGIEERSDNATSSALNSALSPTYGGVHREGQELITNVLIQSSFLSRNNIDYWPLTYQAQIDLVTHLASFDPKIIFLDFYYYTLQKCQRNLGSTLNCPEETLAARWGQTLDPSAYTGEFAAQLKKAAVNSKGQAIPLILGPISPSDPAFTKLRTAFPVGQGSAGIHIPISPQFAYQAYDKDKQLMVAFLIYQMLCQDLKSGCKQPATELNKQTMAIQWGFGNSALQQSIQPNHEGTICKGEGVSQRFLSGIQVIFRSLFQGALQNPNHNKRSADIVACTYHDTLSADQVSQAIDEGQNSGSHQLVSKALKNRVVMVGADISYLSDYFDSPVYGKVPGITVHSMALDNLISKGDNIQRFPKQVIWGLDQADVVESLLMILAMIALIWRHNAILHKSYQPKLANWAFNFAVITVTITVGVFVSWLANWAVLNVFIMTLGIFGVSGILALFKET